MKLILLPAGDFETGGGELAETFAVAYPWIETPVVRT